MDSMCQWGSTRRGSGVTPGGAKGWFGEMSIRCSPGATALGLPGMVPLHAPSAVGANPCAVRSASNLSSEASCALRQTSTSSRILGPLVHPSRRRVRRACGP